MTRYVGRYRARRRCQWGELGRRGRGLVAPVIALGAVAAATVAGPAEAMQVRPFGTATELGAKPTTKATEHAKVGAVTQRAGAGAAGTAVGQAVQRYTAAIGYRVNVRSAPTLRTPGTIVAKLPSGTPLKGRYNSTGYWFHVMAGPWAGRWISGSLMQKTPDPRAVNGRMPSRHLASLPPGSLRRMGSSPRTSLSPAAAHAFADMNAAFRARFGQDIGVVEGYRSLSVQRLYAERFGYPRAAIPGTSNHGLGNAVDLGEAGWPGTSSPFFFGHVYDRWLTENGWKWGFDRPSFMDAGGSNPEFWHYNFVG